MFEMSEKLIVKFYEDMYDGDLLIWKKDKEYNVKCKFNDDFVVENELFEELNYGVSPLDIGKKFDLYRGQILCVTATTNIITDMFSLRLLKLECALSAAKQN